MNIIKILEKRANQFKLDIKALGEKADNSNDVKELRDINQRIENLQSCLEETESILTELRAGSGKNPTLRKIDFRNSSNLGADSDDITNSKEYRTAFMEYITRKKPIPAEFRANQNTTTSDVSAVIPTVIVDKIVERMDECGMILPLVTKTSFAAGIVIPKSNVKPVATWVSEGNTSDKQKKTTTSISFSHFKLRCEISMSIEVSTMALSVFESKFIENVSKAMVIAIEKAILFGNGTTQPKGILKETPAFAKEIKADIPTYAELVDIEANVPAEFEGTAKWFMTKPQFMKFVAMTDQNGQPIARVNYGIDGKIERSILGRDVIIHPYADAMGDNVAAIFDFADYVFNTIYDMGIKNKEDWDTEDQLTKAVMSVDGKAVDNASLITVTVATK